MSLNDECKSRWKPLYEDCVRLRLLWKWTPPGRGGDAERFFLRQHMEDLDSTSSPEINARSYPGSFLKSVSKAIRYLS
jgi:hypothetical protein